MKDLLCNNMLPSERKTEKQTKIALGFMWSQCGVGAVTKALGRCWLAQGTLVSRRKAWASSYDEEGLGRGISTGPLQASGFPFADSAFWAAVTICSLERGPQKNVPCLEMTNSEPCWRPRMAAERQAHPEDIPAPSQWSESPWWLSLMGS